MLYYDRIDVSEGIGINKISVSKESDICHYCYFLHKRFKFQWYVCSGCHDVLMMFVNLYSILSINGGDYRYIIDGISKSDAVNLLKNC